MNLNAVDFPLLTIPATNLAHAGIKRRSIYNDLQRLIELATNGGDDPNSFAQKLRTLSSSIQETFTTETQDLQSLTSFLEAFEDPDADPSSCSRLDRLILEYLHHKGYRETTRAFETHLATNTFTRSLIDALHLHDSIIDDLSRGLTSSAQQWLKSLPTTPEINTLLLRLKVLDCKKLLHDGHVAQVLEKFNQLHYQHPDDPLVLQAAKDLGKGLLLAKSTSTASLLTEEWVSVATLIGNLVNKHFRLGVGAPLLEMIVQAGLVVILTPCCNSEDPVFGCPTCHGPFRDTVKESEIQPSVRVRSSLVCPITRLDLATSQTFALPNGNVYAAPAILKNADTALPHSKVVDPVTGESFDFGMCRKVFIP
ncbi:hypothetical protein RCL1_000267 [Eukaryota sp. TZLM3-RCL]